MKWEDFLEQRKYNSFTIDPNTIPIEMDWTWQDETMIGWVIYMMSQVGINYFPIDQEKFEDIREKLYFLSSYQGKIIFTNERN